MWLILRIGWRSFRRHKRRSIITAAAISFGLALMLFSFGVGEDSHIKMADMGIRMGSGHVVVQGKDYQEEQTLDYVIKDPDAIIAEVESIPGVVTVVPRVRAGGLLSVGGSSTAVAVAGVDPDREPQASSIASDKRRVEGHYLRASDKMEFVNEPADIYIGKALAENLSLAVEDRVVLTVSPRGANRPASAAFRVRGIFRTGIDDLDGFYVEIPIDRAQEMLALGTDVTQVAVLLGELDATAGVTARVKKKLASFDGLEILPWQEALKELYEAIVLDDGGNYFMMAIIFVIVAIGIFNTVLMSVVERTREFGVMMAIGTSGRRLFSIVMAEAFVLAVVSAAVGLALGLGIHWYCATYGLDITALYGDDLEMAGIVFEGRIYSVLPAAVVAKWTLVVMGIVLVSALYPAARAAQLDPVEAMRHA